MQQPSQQGGGGFSRFKGERPVTAAPPVAPAAFDGAPPHTPDVVRQQKLSTLTPERDDSDTIKQPQPDAEGVEARAPFQGKSRAKTGATGETTEQLNPAPSTRSSPIKAPPPASSSSRQPPSSFDEGFPSSFIPVFPSSPPPCNAVAPAPAAAASSSLSHPAIPGRPEQLPDDAPAKQGVTFAADTQSRPDVAMPPPTVLRGASKKGAAASEDILAPFERAPEEESQLPRPAPYVPPHPLAATEKGSRKTVTMTEAKAEERRGWEEGKEAKASAGPTRVQDIQTSPSTSASVSNSRADPASSSSSSSAADAARPPEDSKSPGSTFLNGHSNRMSMVQNYSSQRLQCESKLVKLSVDLGSLESSALCLLQSVRFGSTAACDGYEDYLTVMKEVAGLVMGPQEHLLSMEEIDSLNGAIEAEEQLTQEADGDWIVIDGAV